MPDVPNTAPKVAPKELPKSLLVCPWGESKVQSGKIIVNAKTLENLQQWQELHKRVEVALDFEHATTAPLAERKEPIKVAGYGKLRGVANEGIYYDPTVWTPEGEEFYAGGHYRDISPVVVTELKTGEVIGIVAVALTRAGQIDGLNAYALSAQEFSALNNGGKKPTAGGTPAPQPTKNMDYKSILLAALGLPAGATDDEIKAAATSLNARLEKLKEQNKQTGTPPEGANISELSAKVETLQSTIEQLTKTNELSAKTLLIEGATSQGKNLAISKEKLMTWTLSALSDYVEALPTGAVKITPSGAGAEKVATTQISLSADESSVCRQLNLTPEEYAAQKSKATAQKA